MNKFKKDSTTAESMSQPQTFGDMMDGVFNEVLDTKAEEIKQAVTADTKKARGKRFTQQLETAPTELTSQPRFFPVNENKLPIITEWQKPENQRDYREINGLKGFDTCGHGRAPDYLFLDFDHVLDDAGNFVNDAARRWYNFVQMDFSGYCERSISGHGLHILAKPTPNTFKPINAGSHGTIYFGKHDTPAERKANPKLEIFYGAGARYILLTGIHFDDCGNTIAEGSDVDGVFQQLLDEIQKQNQPAQSSKVDSSAGTSTAADDRAIMSEILATVHPRDCEYAEWRDFGMVAMLVGIPFEEFDAWSSKDDSIGGDGKPRYNPDKVKYFWEHYKTAAELGDGGIKIGTAIDIAKRHGYTPPRKSSDNYTTQKFLADCPLDLEIPYGFSVSRHGIKKLIPKKNGDGFSEIVVSRTPVIVTKRFVEKKSISVEYELAFKTVYENKWIRKTFDAATIGDARQFTTLIQSGISAQNHKMLAVYFDELINSPTNAQKIQSVTMHSQTGWTDETFTEFIYPSPDADYIVRRAGFDFHKELGTRGDADIWKKTFVDAMKHGGAVARIYSGFALAAPLVRPFNLPNLQSHLHAESGKGKTALEKLTASIFGNPKEMIRTFEATPKNRQAVAAAYCDLPTFLDELGTLKGKKADEYLSQSIYAYSLGNQNQAQKQTGDTRPLVKFYGARLSTGERAILKNHDPRGSFKRLPQLPCRNLFPDKFGAKLHLISESNFGHFGRPWINFVTKHLKKICDEYQLFATAFTQSDKYEATLVKSIVAAAVAYQFFMICIGEQSNFDEAALDADIQKILEDMPTVKEISDDTRAVEALSSFVASHPKHFITEYEANGKMQEREAAATPTFGKRFQNGEVAFHPDQLEKILETELKFSDCEAIVTALANQGKLITNTGRTRHRIRLDGELVRTVHFAAGILSDGYNDFTPPPL